MTVTRSPKNAKQKAEALEAFVAAAPDAGAEQAEPAKVPGFKQGNKQQITHTMTVDMLLRLETRRKELGLTRAAFINLAVNNMLENGASVAGSKS